MTIIPKIKNDGFIFYDSSCDLYRVVQIHKEVQDMKKENTMNISKKVKSKK